MFIPPDVVDNVRKVQDIGFHFSGICIHYYNEQNYSEVVQFFSEEMLLQSITARRHVFKVSSFV